MIVSVGAPASVQGALEDGEMGSVSPDKTRFAQGGGGMDSEKGAYAALFSKVRSMVALYRKYSRSLTFVINRRG